MKRELDQSFDDDVSFKAKRLATERLTPGDQRLAPEVATFCAEFGNVSDTDIDLRRVMDDFVSIYEKLDDGHDVTVKPNYSYTELVYLAVLRSPNFCLPIGEIYKYIQSKFQFFKTGTRQHWRNAVRHSLSKTKCFTKISVGRNPNPAGIYQRSTFLWSIVPSSILNFARGDYRPNVDRESGTNTLRWGFYRVNAGEFWDEVATALENKMAAFRESIKTVASPSEIFQSQVCLLNFKDVETSTQILAESKWTPESQFSMTSPAQFNQHQVTKTINHVTPPLVQTARMQYRPLQHYQQQQQFVNSPVTSTSQPFDLPTETSPMIPSHLLPRRHFLTYSPVSPVECGSLGCSRRELGMKSPVEPDIKISPSLRHQMTSQIWSPDFLLREGAMSSFNLTSGSDSDTSIRSEKPSCQELSPLTHSSEARFWLPPPNMSAAPPNVTVISGSEVGYKAARFTTGNRMATPKQNTYVSSSSPLTENSSLNNSTPELSPFSEMSSITSLLAFDNNVDYSSFYSPNGSDYYDMNYGTPQRFQQLLHQDWNTSYSCEKQNGSWVQSENAWYQNSANSFDAPLSNSYAQSLQ